MEVQEVHLVELLKRLDDYHDVLNVLDGVRGNPSVEQKYAVLKALVENIRISLETLCSTIAKSNKLCITMQAQSLQFDLLHARMREQMNNCNIRVSTPLPNGGVSGWVSPGSVSAVEQFVTPSSAHERQHRLALPNFGTRGLSPVDQSVSHLPSACVSSASIVENGTTPKPRRDMEIAISYISRADFDAIPQYMRGRVRFDEIAAFIDLFNVVLNKKYALMRKPKKTVKAKNEMDLLSEWKQQTHPELSSQYFINENDFVSLNKHKLSLKDRNIITMLRHVHRLKEIRIKKVCYYLACF